MSFKDLGLNEDILKSIKLQGYETPTPIQMQAIPAIFEGKDVLAGAQTGTGKTAAFALPLLQKLSTNKSRQHKPKSLILTPTRELALQVKECISSYNGNKSVYITEVYGGVSINPQISRLRKGTDIIVATPGRLLDHIQRKTVDLSQVDYLVLDEADRMLDMGFINDIRKIVSALPKKRQNLMFSATYSNSIRKLADTILNNPVNIEVANRNMATETVTQYVHPVHSKKKRQLLTSLIKEENWGQVLVFTRTKSRANTLTNQLVKEGIKAAAIHGNKSQSARSKTLLNFKNGRVKILVATDVASRGIDIEMLPHVVNYDLPVVPEDYVHRIGRTGRAGQNGIALSLVSREEQDLLRRIERLMNRKIDVKKIDGFNSETKPEIRTVEVTKKNIFRKNNSPKRKNFSSEQLNESVFSLAVRKKPRTRISA